MILDGFYIPDGLIEQLEANFGSHNISNCKTWEQTCELKGALKVLDWLKDKQEELKQAQFANTETITIDSS